MTNIIQLSPPESVQNSNALSSLVLKLFSLQSLKTKKLDQGYKPKNGSIETLIPVLAPKLKYCYITQPLPIERMEKRNQIYSLTAKQIFQQEYLFETKKYAHKKINL